MVEQTLAAVERARDVAKSDAAFYAKTLIRLRHTLMHVTGGLEDEGDRIYFGSTNHADALKDVAQTIDGMAWDRIMETSQPPVDLYKIIADLRTALSEAEERIKALTTAMNANARAFVAEVEKAMAAEAERDASLARISELEARAPLPNLVGEQQWPEGTFSVFDPEPENHHSALYLVLPGGLSLNVSCDAREGVDMARANWMAAALNAAHLYGTPQAATPAAALARAEALDADYAQALAKEVQTQACGPSFWGQLTAEGRQYFTDRIQSAHANAAAALSPAPTEPCFECGSTERIGTACAHCNPDLSRAPTVGIKDHLPSQEWLDRHVATDPDDACVEVRTAPTVEGGGA